jgi:hypothetical protein
MDVKLSDEFFSVSLTMIRKGNFTDRAYLAKQESYHQTLKNCGYDLNITFTGFLCL